MRLIPPLRAGKNPNSLSLTVVTPTVSVSEYTFRRPEVSTCMCVCVCVGGGGGGGKGDSGYLVWQESVPTLACIGSLIYLKYSWKRPKTNTPHHTHTKNNSKSTMHTEYMKQVWTLMSTQLHHTYQTRPNHHTVRFWPWAGYGPPSPLPRGNFVHYDFLKLQYIRNKMTHVSPLAMGAFTCNSHVTNVTLTTMEIIWCKY